MSDHDTPSASMEISAPGTRNTTTFHDPDVIQQQVAAIDLAVTQGRTEPLVRRIGHDWIPDPDNPADQGKAPRVSRILTASAGMPALARTGVDLIIWIWADREQMQDESKPLFEQVLVMTTMGHMLKGRLFQDGDIVPTGPVQKIAFVRVLRQNLEQHFPDLMAWYKSRGNVDPVVLQIIPSDAQGLFPWEEGCHEIHKAGHQPLNKEVLGSDAEGIEIRVHRHDDGDPNLRS